MQMIHKWLKKNKNKKKIYREIENIFKNIINLLLKNNWYI